MAATTEHDRVLNVISAIAFVMGVLVVAGSFLAGFKTAHTTLIFAAVPATLAALLYGLLAPWWKSALGRILMSLMCSVAVLLDLTLVLNTYFSMNPTVALFIARAVFAMTGVVAWVLVAYIILAQAAPRLYSKNFPGRHEDGTIPPHG